MTCTSSSPRFISSQALDSLSFVHPVVKDGEIVFSLLSCMEGSLISGRFTLNGKFLVMWIKLLGCDQVWIKVDQIVSAQDKMISPHF